MSIIKQEMSTLLNLTIRENLRTITEVISLIDEYFTKKQDEIHVYQEYLKLTRHHKEMMSIKILMNLPKYHYEEVRIHDVNGYWIIQ